MEKQIKNLIEILFNPKNIATHASILFVTTILLACNLLPEKIKVQYKIIEQLTQFNFYILVIFLFCLAMTLYKLNSYVTNYIKQLHSDRKVKKEIFKLFDDPFCWGIITEMYNSNGEPLLLDLQNQKIAQLQRYNIITPSTSKIIIPLREAIAQNLNPKMPCILQPLGEDYIHEYLKKFKKTI